MKLAIDQIVVSKDNPRQTFDEEGLRRLGESIKSHGQLQPIIVRRKGSFFELVVGERRVRASALVGLMEIDATVREVDDVTVMELRLIENTQREDLSDAEKGDAVLALWANYDKYKTIADVARAINVNYETARAWTNHSRKLSTQIRERVASHALTDEHAKELMKYSHSVQNKLADAIIRNKISSHKEVLRRFTDLYDLNPNANLDTIANQVLGIETVAIPKTELTKKQLEKIEEKKQLAKVKRIRKKPSKPITKEDVKKKLAKKTDFKYAKVKVKHGSGKVTPPSPMIKPNILGNTQPITVDWSLCLCNTCPLFGEHCKGRPTQ